MTTRRKPGSNYGKLSSAILQAIADLGPMTRAEICDHLSSSHNSVSSVIARLRKSTPECPQRLYVCGYVEDHEGQRGYIRAQYALGAEPDARKRRPAARQRRSALVTAKEDRLRMSSVFHLGMTRNQLRERARQIREMYGEAA